MQRLAAPMVGGMIMAPLLSLLLSAIYKLLGVRQFMRAAKVDAGPAAFQAGTPQLN